METNKELFNIQQKLDELLSLREVNKNSRKRLDFLIRDGIKTLKGLPERWYVRNANKSVIDYLNNKHNRSIPYIENYSLGYGELHGELAFVPPDVDYSWKITQEEFDYAMTFYNNL